MFSRKVKNKNNKNKNDKKTNYADEPKKDAIDLTKEPPIYKERIEQPKIPNNKNDSSENQKPLKINGYETKRSITKAQIKLLKTKFEKFYERTVTNNCEYFESMFINLIKKLKKNIDNLEVSNDFSNSFLQWYDDLKEARHEAKEYIKKIDLAFEEARKNKNNAPDSKNANYKFGSFIDIENNITGDELKREKSNLFYFISETTELKEKISNYHPITREMENLSLAKACESYYKTYIENFRKIRKSYSAEDYVPNGIVDKEKQKKFEQIQSIIENQTKEYKDDYDFAIKNLESSLEKRNSITSAELPKDINKKLNETFEEWDKKRNDLKKKLNGIKYQGENTAKIKKAINNGTSFFSKLIKKITGVQSDIDEANAMLMRYGIIKK